MTTMAHSAGVNTTSLVRPALAVAFTAALLNGVIFAASVAAGIFPALRLDPAAGPQMALELVVFVSVIASLAGLGIFALMRRRMRDALRAFTRVAGVVLVLSFVPPFLMPNTLTQALVLNVMHVVAAALVVGAAHRVSR